MPGLHEIRPPAGSRKDRRRRGRGDAANQGSYSGRGGKGQRKRGSVRLQFEGGQLPLVKRLPYMRGFFNHFRVSYTAVNLDSLADFPAGVDITPDTLRAAGLVAKWDDRVKLLGDGDVSQAFKITVHAASKSARQKVEAAGGSVTVLDQPFSERTPRKAHVKKAAPKAVEAPAAEAKPDAKAEAKASPKAEAKQPAAKSEAKPAPKKADKK